jgi:hypothetical protein
MPTATSINRMIQAFFLTTISTCAAFLPQQTPTSWGVQTVSVNSFTSVADLPSTKLYGAFDDFLSGSDDSARAKKNTEYLRGLERKCERINGLESKIEQLGDDEMLAKTLEFKDRIAKGEDLNGKLLEEAFALVREAAWYVNPRFM